MIALLQRVSNASVVVGDECIATIGAGLLVLVGVVRADNERRAERLAERVTSYRMFADVDGKMNLSVRDTGGSVLLVPQFTLVADTRKGNRASFTPVAPPDMGVRLFDFVVTSVRALGVHTECGRFGADMKVSLTNDGPVTFWLEA